MLPDEHLILHREVYRNMQPRQQQPKYPLNCIDLTQRDHSVGFMVKYRTIS